MLGVLIVIGVLLFLGTLSHSHIYIYEIANICWIMGKAREFKKKHLFLLY